MKFQMANEALHFSASIKGGMGWLFCSSAEAEKAAVAVSCPLHIQEAGSVSTAHHNFGMRHP